MRGTWKPRSRHGSGECRYIKLTWKCVQTFTVVVPRGWRILTLVIPNVSMLSSRDSDPYILTEPLAWLYTAVLLSTSCVSICSSFFCFKGSAFNLELYCVTLAGKHCLCNCLPNICWQYIYNKFPTGQNDFQYTLCFAKAMDESLLSH